MPGSASRTIRWKFLSSMRFMTRSCSFRKALESSDESRLLQSLEVVEVLEGAVRDGDSSVKLAVPGLCGARVTVAHGERALEGEILIWVVACKPRHETPLFQECRE